MELVEMWQSYLYDRHLDIAVLPPISGTGFLSQQLEPLVPTLMCSEQFFLRIKLLGHNNDGNYQGCAIGLRWGTPVSVYLVHSGSLVHPVNAIWLFHSSLSFLIELLHTVTKIRWQFDPARQGTQL